MPRRLLQLSQFLSPRSFHQSVFNSGFVVSIKTGLRVVKEMCDRKKGDEGEK